MKRLMTASMERKWDFLARGNLVELKVACLMLLERKVEAEKNQEDNIFSSPQISEMIT